MRITLFTVLIIAVTVSCNKDPRPSLNKKAVGKSANDFLSDKNYNKLTIELVSVEGYEPESSVIDDLKSFANALIHKPDGIQIKSSTIAPPGLAPYSLEDIKSLEDQLRSEYNAGKELTLFILITDDEYTNSNVLGLAYRNTSFAIMGGTIREATGGIGQPPENLVLRTVIRHELGHLLGLVNVGTEMQTQHQDTDHGHHCDVEDCLMYWAVESEGFLQNLLGMSQPPELDSQCKTDLQANGGK